MIEVTCAACGSVNRIADADVPVGAKFATCSSCKSRIALGRTGTTVPPQTAPIPVPVPAKREQVIDLADLPTPKRTSALGAEPSKPAPKSGLAAALDAELPVPKRGPEPYVDNGAFGKLADLPTPKSAGRGVTDLLAPKPGLADLPKRAKADVGDLPSPKPKPGDLSDLPSPKGFGGKPTAKPGLGDLPGPKGPAPLGDLPVPKGPPALADLPTPKRPSGGQPAPKTGFGDLPAPKGAPGLADLPTPKRSPGLGDLPAPKGAPGLADLPTPKAGATSKASSPKAKPAGDPFGDLPAPKQPAASLDDDWGDLPSPRADTLRAVPAPDEDITDLPAPKSVAGIDLPTPKPGVSRIAANLERSGFTDPQPSKQVTQDLRSGPGMADVPAPKGFFDDLPQPARGGSGLPAPLGFFDDLPQAKSPNAQPSNLPAPVGFFDDLPQAKSGGGAEPPAPKGFFDDLPQAKSGEARSKGFYDDLPQDAPIDISKPKGFFDDLPQPTRTKPESLKLDIAVQPTETHAPHLDLEPAPQPPPGVAIRIEPAPPSPAPPAPAMHDEPIGLIPTKDADIELKLEGEARAPITTPKLQPKRARDKAARPARATKRRPWVMIVLLVIVAAGAGGYYYYQRRVAAQERAETVGKELNIARSALAAADPAHWQRASTAVGHVLEVEPDNSEALAIGAEAAIAGALETGLGGPMKLGSGRRMLSDAMAAGANGPQLVRAQGLAAIAANQADHAVELLKPLAAQSPKDPFLALYLGWAYAAAGDQAAAIKALEPAIGAPPTKLAALDARGRAKLAAGDLQGARADFTAILEAAKDHIGAQVGLAAATTAAQAPQREADLLAILARKDIATADPRAVALAWSLAADDARRTGRFDSARERYRKALALQDKDVAAMTGLADVELRDGKLDAALEMIGKASAAQPAYVPAQLVAAEIAIAQNRNDDAAKILDVLAARTPPLAALDAAHAKLATGKLREAQGQEDAALDAYVEAANLAGEIDLAPRMAAVTKLMAASHKAADAKDAKRAAELRDRGDQLLGGLIDQAQHDPAVAMTLGVAYLEAGDPAKAESWLRKVVDARPDDVGAMFQLAKVLARLGRSDEAIGELKKALDKDAARTDIALELARSYEAAGRDDEAVAVYDKLLASPDVSLELRGYAGRFFIKRHDVAKGAAQGEAIGKVEAFNPAGMYLRAEGLLAAGNIEGAVNLFKRAAEAEPDPVYLDGWGRAAEAQAIQGNDARFQDVALRAYQQAHDAAPTMLNPLAGIGRIYLARHEAAKAVQPLLDASKLEPTDPEIAFEIGAAYQELQQKTAAIKWLELAAREKPRAETRWRLGELYYDAQHDHEASSNLAAAVKLANDDEKATGKKVEWLTDALYDLGSIYIALHQDGAARDAWNQYLARSPKNAAQVNEVKYKLATELRRP